MSEKSPEDRRSGIDSDRTEFDLFLVLFYVSCTIFATACAVSLVALMTYAHTTAGVAVGSVFGGVALVTAFSAWWCLRRARREA